MPKIDFTDVPREQDRRRRGLMTIAIMNVLLDPDEATPVENTIAALVAEAGPRDAAPTLERRIAAGTNAPFAGGMQLKRELLETLEGLHPDTVEHIFITALQEHVQHSKDTRRGRWARANPEPLPRDMKKAMRELEETIHRQLTLPAPGGSRVSGLTPAIVRNLAATILGGIEEYGR